jgi:polyprenyl-phospho-N-acetylgalactosaminyl synthase
MGPVPEFRPCVLIPTYDNPRTIRDVVERARGALSDVLVVDDGSHAEAREELERIAKDGLAMVVHRDTNGGKGAAVKTGFRALTERGYTHALQIDADGQHDLGDAERFLELGRADPDALVLGQPIFDGSAPLGRRIGRRITIFWTRVEGGRSIGDPMCGYRLYPLAHAVPASEGTGDRMDFDPEIAVRIVWRGARALHVPTRVHYERGGVSHFSLWRDNWLISKMHSRLMWRKMSALFLGRRALAASTR